MACDHTAAKEPPETYALGVKLALAVALNKAEYTPACSICGSTITPIACLECDLVACPKHGKNHANDHHLGVCLWPSTQGQVWCWTCDDTCVNMKYEHVRFKVIHDVMSNGPPIPELDEEYPFEPSTRGLAKIPYHAHTGMRGFVNMGATCYISVILQALLHNPLVRAFFLAGGHCHQVCTKPNCLACCVDRVYCSFYSSKKVSGFGIADLLIAVATKNPDMGAGATEQDAHEFMHFLLEELHRSHLTPSETFGASLSSDPMACNCVAHRNFGGCLESKLACSCGFVRHTRDPLIDVSLEVSDKLTTLQQSLARFTSIEPLMNYTCEKCHKLNTVTKRILIKRVPPVLLIQLKRFKHAGVSHKVETPVKFPLEVDLAPYTTKPDKRKLVYELYGVVCHQGSLDTGHYTCIMKNSSGAWFHFDDTMVTMVPVSHVLSVNAYLLFYIVKWTI